MKKTFLFGLLIMCLLSINVYAIDQNELARYEFEEGSGSILIDSSGNSFHGIVNNMGWDNANEKWGVYAGDFDETALSNQYCRIPTITANAITDELTISFWVQEHTGPPQTNKETYFEFQNNVNTDNVIILYYDSAMTNLYLDYYDTSNVTRTQTLDTTGFSVGTYYHIVIQLNLNTSFLEYYRDTVLTFNNSLTYDIQFNKDEASKLILGCLDDLVTCTDIYMDEFRAFRTALDTDQIDSLYNNNNISFPVEAPPINYSNISTYQEIEIITSATPANGAHVDPGVNIEVTTNHVATCELYIDNSLTETYYNILAFSYGPLFDVGNYSYFTYCYYIDGDIYFYDLDSEATFTIDDYDPTEVVFKINPEDFDVSEYNLWVTSPCLKKGGGIEIGDNLPYEAKYNPDGAYFAQVDNDGYAIFNLTPDTYEFCLFSGRVVVNEDNKTTNYDIVQVSNNLDLGVLDIPNNITSYFEISVDKFSILAKYDPEAWGKTWPTVIGGIIMLLLGVVALMSGMAQGNGKITIAGVLLVLSGFGISFGGLLGVLI